MKWDTLRLRVKDSSSLRCSDWPKEKEGMCTYRIITINCFELEVKERKLRKYSHRKQKVAEEK